MIKGDLISDLELRLSAAKPSDDDSVNRRQISDWIDLARDNYYASIIESRNFDRSLIHKEEELPVLQKENTHNPTQYYVDLEFLPLHNKVNRGIIMVNTDSGNTVYEEDFEHMKELSNLLFSNPKSTNLAYYQEGNRIYFEGFTSLSYTENKINVYYIPSEVDREASETDNYFLSPSDKDFVIKMAFEIGMQEMAQGDGDTENDGE